MGKIKFVYSNSQFQDLPVEAQSLTKKEVERMDKTDNGDIVRSPLQKSVISLFNFFRSA
jgi:hypothetical protein